MQWFVDLYVKALAEALGGLTAFCVSAGIVVVGMFVVVGIPVFLFSMIHMKYDDTLKKKSRQVGWVSGWLDSIAYVRELEYPADPKGCGATFSQELKDVSVEDFVTIRRYIAYRLDDDSAKQKRKRWSL